MQNFVTKYGYPFRNRYCKHYIDLSFACLEFKAELSHLKTCIVYGLLLCPNILAKASQQDISWFQIGYLFVFWQWLKSEQNNILHTYTSLSTHTPQPYIHVHTLLYTPPSKHTSTLFSKNGTQTKQSDASFWYHAVSLWCTTLHCPIPIPISLPICCWLCCIVCHVHLAGCGPCDHDRVQHLHAKAHHNSLAATAEHQDHLSDRWRYQPHCCQLQAANVCCGTMFT